MASQKMSLKLLVDKSGQKVLFAEANKDFVDFLFHIFSLPLGTLIEFLGSKQMVGCLAKLKDSIQSLNETYIQPGIEKDDIYNPQTPYPGNTLLLSYNASSSVQSPYPGNTLLLSYNASSSDQSGASKTIYTCSRASEKCHRCEYNNYQSCRGYATLFAHTRCPNCRDHMNVEVKIVIPKKYGAAEEKKRKVTGNYVKEVVTIYTCSRALEKCHNCAYEYDSYISCRGYATLFTHARCPSCSDPMNVEARIVIPKMERAMDVEKKIAAGGYVKEVVTYMVMDDLMVKPMSTISSVTLINSFGVKDLRKLEEKLVSFGEDEALKLLKASLSTDKVLTTLFLHKNFAN